MFAHALETLCLICHELVVNHHEVNHRDGHTTIRMMLVSSIDSHLLRTLCRRHW